MNLTNIHLLRDSRINGLSVSAVTTIRDYINWFNQYGLKNKLNEQRPQLNTRSGNMIRRRLIEDLKDGAIIPPIVIGFSTNEKLDSVSKDNVSDIIKKNLSNATVIDGMQRSGALTEALNQKQQIANTPIRIDVWISNGTIGLIYRMLVLNTGQTPWDVKQQMEVIYKPLLNETKERIQGIVLNERSERRRRTAGGEYPASSIIELFIAFSSRKELVSPADRVADDFTRLDITKMAGAQHFSEVFFGSLKMMVQFDKAVSRYKVEDNSQLDDQKFTNGLDLFTNMPAKVGFIVALAQRIVGRAGMTERNPNQQEDLLKQLSFQFDVFINRLQQMNNEALGFFLQYDILNECVNSLPVKRIGNAQREFFRTGFTALIDSNFEVDNLEIVWRAY